MNFSYIHIYLHFIVPAIVPLLCYVYKRSFSEKTEKGAFYLRQWLILSATIVVDLDHLLASPIYVPERCSIGFHPLHHEVAIVIYGIMLLSPKTRLIAGGLLIHMSLDYLDCFY